MGVEATEMRHEGVNIMPVWVKGSEIVSQSKVLFLFMYRLIDTELFDSKYLENE